MWLKCIYPYKLLGTNSHIERKSKKRQQYVDSRTHAYKHVHTVHNYSYHMLLIISIFFVQNHSYIFFGGVWICARVLFVILFVLSSFRFVSWQRYFWWWYQIKCSFGTERKSNLFTWLEQYFCQLFDPPPPQLVASHFCHWNNFQSFAYACRRYGSLNFDNSLVVCCSFQCIAQELVQARVRIFVRLYVYSLPTLKNWIPN